MTKKILIKKGNKKLIAQVVNESSKQRVSVMLYQESKNGEVSVPIIVQRADLLKKSKNLQDLLNLSICLSEDELDKVIEKAINLLESADKVDDAENIDSQATPSQLYRAICEYGKEVVSNPIIPQTEDEPKQMIWIDGNYLNVRTSDFNDFIKGVPEADEYKKTDIFRSLKLLGVLDTDAGRAYDKKVSKGNKKYNCYRIQMPAEKSKKAIIPVEVVEETPAVESLPAELNDGVQVTVEEIIAETEAKQSKPEESEQPKLPSSEKEKMKEAVKELFAEDAGIKITPTVTKTAETLTEEDYGGCCFD